MRGNPMECVYYRTRYGWMLCDDEGNRTYYESEGALLADYPQAERMD